jgi:hypothetical protein
MTGPVRHSPTARPVVFAGPSVDRHTVLAHLPGADVRPPVQRGDLRDLYHAGHRLFVLIDGVFSHGLAVSPREVVDVLRGGATVVGASSMGAVRAAECWPAGMQGVGVVFRLFRAGIIDSDDEVAVMTDPEQDYRAISVALINVRFAARKAFVRGLLSKDESDAIVRAAEDLHFLQRTWPVILQKAGVSAGFRDALGQVDVKREDAIRALRQVATGYSGAGLAAAEATAEATAEAPVPAEERVRYPGHDRLLGHDRDDLVHELTRWMFGSGRYQRHVWSLVAGEEDLLDLPPRGAGRAEALRERLALCLSRLLAEPRPLAASLWEELEFLDELPAELMRWHALKRFAALAGDDRDGSSHHRLVREQTAIAHGYLDWASLRGDVQDGKLFGAIPFGWVDAAVSLQVAARRGAQSYDACGEAAS